MNYVFRWTIYLVLMFCLGVTLKLFLGGNYNLYSLMAGVVAGSAVPFIADELLERS